MGLDPGDDKGSMSAETFHGLFIQKFQQLKAHAARNIYIYIYIKRKLYHSLELTLCRLECIFVNAKQNSIFPT